MDNVNEPVTIELSMEILDKLAIKEIIYAEYSLPGSMGNAGGVMIYAIADGNFNCYKANILNDKNIYKKAVDILEKNQITSRYNDIRNENGIFKFYGGGMGNNVLINKNISLEFANGYLIYSKNDKEYNIYSSVQGVFNCVEYEMRMQNLLKNPSKHRDFLDKEDYDKDYIDEAKKQKELLHEKLDKEIIIGKVYTEKEINAILKDCCTSQDYVSFRRSLIDKGYLNRTNDCREYWREICQEKTAF